MSSHGPHQIRSRDGRRSTSSSTTHDDPLDAAAAPRGEEDGGTGSAGAARGGRWLVQPHQQTQQTQQQRQQLQVMAMMPTRTMSPPPPPSLPPSLPRNDGDIALLIPPGLRLRDEFLCPITRELIVEPVIAADGHTYDRAAIERWIHRSSSRRTTLARSNNPVVTSPKTGQALEHLHLIPNHNLKRLLRDMIREGGGNGLWCREDGVESGNVVVPSPATMSPPTLSPAGSFSWPSFPYSLANPTPSAFVAATSSAAVAAATASVISPTTTIPSMAGSPHPETRPTSPASPSNNHNHDPSLYVGGETRGVLVAGRRGLCASTQTQQQQQQQQQPAIIPRVQSPPPPFGNNGGPLALSSLSPPPPLPSSPPRPTPRLALVRTRVVRCRCLGPPESDWNGRSFRFAEPIASPGAGAGGGGTMVSIAEPASLMGGRRRPHEGGSGGGGAAGGGGVGGDDFVQFADATVSRKHFELRFVSEEELLDPEGRRKLGCALSDFGGVLIGDDDVNDDEEEEKEDERKKGGLGGNCLSRLLASSNSGESNLSFDAGGGARRRKRGWFVLRDLGSAGGTFVRVPPGRGARLRPGSMIMLGKHQLVALAPPSAPSTSSSSSHLSPLIAKTAVEPPPSDVGGCDKYRTSELTIAAPASVPASSCPSSAALYGRRSSSLTGFTGGSSAAATTTASSLLSRPTSPFSIVAGTDILTPRYGDPHARDDRFYFTERSEAAGAGGGNCPTLQRSFTSPGVACEGGALNTNTNLTVVPDLNETTEEEGGAGGEVGGDGQFAGLDDKGAEDDLNVDVSYDDEEDEVEAIHVPQDDHRLTMSDLGLRLPALSHAATTDAAGAGANSDKTKAAAAAAREGGVIRFRGEGAGSLPGPKRDHNKDEPILVLRCFAPEGTPLQGREYPLTRVGVTLGRKAGNAISFSHRIGAEDLARDGGGAGGGPSPEGGAHLGAFVGIDSSISGEHATISYDHAEGCLHLMDGPPPSSGGGRGTMRGSTNGTWLRLSAMHEPSGWFVLEDKMEILVGTVRFQMEMDEIVVERDFYD